MWDNKQNSNKQEPMSDQEFFHKMGMGAVCLIALWAYKNELSIKAWLYDNLLLLVLLGFVAIVGMGSLIHWRIRKNNQEAIKRNDGLKTIKTTKPYMDYYQPIQKKGESDETTRS